MKTFISWVLVFSALITPAFGAVREPAVAGQFYPSDPKELSSFVDDLLAKATPPEFPGEAVAYLAPHAAYPFSGSVAATVFKALSKTQYQTVILVGAAHHYPVKTASLFPKGSFKTPLGEVEVDHEIALKLMKRRPQWTEVVELAHLKEHSIEVELPFFQRTLMHFKIVPILVGNADFETSIDIGNNIAQIVQENIDNGKPTIIVASSDLSHYPRRTDAELVDKKTLEAIKTLDPKVFSDSNRKILKDKVPGLICTMCGDTAMIALMQAAKQLGADQATVLKYANSADSVLGDINKVVGYGGVVFSKSTAKEPETESVIQKKEQKRLLKIARKTLQDFVTLGVIPEIKGNEIAAKPVPIFMTLWSHGELRGCMGSPEPMYALEPAIRQFTYKAASQDPRFLPVKEEELSKIEIEISILSPLEKVQSANGVKPFQNGVVMEQGDRRGLFLPEVWKTFPEKEEFLGKLASEKLGLSKDAWKDPKTLLYVFTAQSFRENEST